MMRRVAMTFVGAIIAGALWAAWGWLKGDVCTEFLGFAPRNNAECIAGYFGYATPAAIVGGIIGFFSGHQKNRPR